jgi:hypothetical protein
MQDLVVAAHDRVEDALRFLHAFELGLGTAPDHWKPLARHDQLRADGDARDESIEVGKLHAVFRSTIGHQERVEFLEVEVTRAKQRRAHAALLHRVASFADRRRFWHTVGPVTSVLC